ncbi:MAG TPA: AI-2E family transporter, partial [Pyrinomonadaceae bacterium]|nr:AI-2E family transporter [Pyrinomonadaceae bacterium]
QLVSCVLIGTVCTIGFYLIGLKYALLLGILAGIFEFVPLIGPLVIAIVAITTAGFSDDPWKALYVGIFLLVLRITHDYVTYPRIVRGGLHLHPLAVVLSVLAGEQVAGIAGVFLAIPLVAIGTVIYRHVLEHQGSRGLFAGIIESEEKSIEEEA